MRQVRIAIGLPASGKTTFYRKLAEKDRSVVLLNENGMSSFFTSFDKSDCTRCRPISDETYLLRIREYHGFYGTLLLDGLFLNTERIALMLDRVFEDNKVDEVILDYWPENKEACLRNDYKRRRQGSALSIKALSIHVDFEFLKAKYSGLTRIIVEEHEIFQVPDYVLYFRDYGLVDLPDERYLDSDTWVVGGQSRACENGWSCIDADEAPKSFRELEDLLCRISPSFPLSLAMEIHETCVETKERQESDYYSTVNLQYFRCDLERLWNILSRTGYTKNQIELSMDAQERIPPCTLCPNCMHFHNGAHAPICRDCIRNSFLQFEHVETIAVHNKNN